jgi:hypothetical protein
MLEHKLPAVLSAGHDRYSMVTARDEICRKTTQSFPSRPEVAKSSEANQLFNLQKPSSRQGRT